MRSIKRPLFAILAMSAFLAGVAALFVYTIAVPFPVDEAGALTAARSLGFTDAAIVARVGGQAAVWELGCGEGEMSACTMRATGADGSTVTFIACCGGAGGRSCSIRQKMTPR